MLSRGSRVFKSMLGPHFKEGQELARASTLELPLPDDDAGDVATICYAMHVQTNMMSTQLDADAIVKLARLADKYDCTEATKYYASHMISKHLRKLTNPYVRSQLLVAAFYFQLEDLVHTIAKDMILKNGGVIYCHFDDLADTLVKLFSKSNDLPTSAHEVNKITVRLEQKRCHALLALASGIDHIVRHENGLRTRITVASDCLCDYFFVCALLRSLDNSKLWPAGLRHNRPICDILDELTRFNFVLPNKATACKGVMSQCAHRGLSSSSEIQTKLDFEVQKVRTRIEDECLLCDHAGSDQVACDHSSNFG